MNPVKSPWPVRTVPCSRPGTAPSAAVGINSMVRIRTRAGGGSPPAQLAESTTPPLPSHTRTPSLKSFAAMRLTSNTLPLLSVTRTSRPRASMRAMSPKRAMNGRPRIDRTCAERDSNPKIVNARRFCVSPALPVWATHGFSLFNPLK